jgi:hypothetical protein
MAALAFPGVQTEVMVIAARRNERRAGAQALGHLKAQYTAIKRKRTIEIGHLEMNMPDPHACNDGWIFGHGLSPFVVLHLARLRGQ